MTELALPVLTAVLVPEGELATDIVPFGATIETGMRNVAVDIVEIDDGFKKVDCAVCERAKLIPEDGLIHEELVLASVSTLAEL